jgi:flavin-dependent dehydrogenase
MAALGVARRGLRVLVVDRAAHPRSKVCGCCLNLRALHSIAEAGLADVSARLGAIPLTRFRLAAGGRLADIKLPGGMAVSRAAFDAALVHAAIDAGADFLPRTDARLGGGDRSLRTLQLRNDFDRATAAARVIVAADGVGGRLLAAEPACRRVQRPASRIGAAAQLADASEAYAAGTIYMACGTDGYVGLVRVEDGRLNVAAALDREALRCRHGLSATVAANLRAAGLPAPRTLASAAWHGTPALTQRLTYPAAERIFAIGDAARYVEPFTGDGIAGALESGAGVVPFAVRACRTWDKEVADQWVRWHRRHQEQRQQLCQTVANVLRFPAVIPLIVGLVARLPVLAAPLVRYLNTSTKQGRFHR